jgi:hypothetical protein
VSCLSKCWTKRKKKGVCVCVCFFWGGGVHDFNDLDYPQRCKVAMLGLGGRSLEHRLVRCSLRCSNKKKSASVHVGSSMLSPAACTHRRQERLLSLFVFLFCGSHIDAHHYSLLHRCWKLRWFSECRCLLLWVVLCCFVSTHLFQMLYVMFPEYQSSYTLITFFLVLVTS